ncbi:MAG: hypothetical protein OXG66_12780 [Acidimicrobiaceae bacterium]|nr:hypothetical protein [Acidimicrobiaceae bacterium]MCY3644754.1 hypothetical protein [Acidimicrobiaceae bacterium]
MRPLGGAGTRVGAVLVGAVVALTVVFLVVNLRPWLWFDDTTPTGGDLGAHVWAPAYLRDVLIPELRLTGWTHDWYAGFPAFAFYMVIPSLLVVIVDAGLDLSVGVFAYLAVVGAVGGLAMLILGRTGWAAAQRWALAVGIAAIAGAAKLFVGDAETNRAIAALLLPAACGGWAWHLLRARPRWRAPGAVAAVLLAVLVVPMPYGVALKVVAIAGVVALPIAVWAMVRTSGVGFEGQALASVATLLFLFDRSFNIYGGNLMSTMAGEFAYSLGLAVAVLFVGVAARGMDSNRHSVLAGALLALTGLLHLFSAFLALAATAALLLTGRWQRAAWLQRLKWTLVTGALSAALSAWWVLPFWWNRGLLNDMGWGKERRYLSSLWSRSSFDYGFLVNHPALQFFIVVAVAGSAVLFFRRSRPRAERWSRLHVALAVTGAIFAAAFVVMPEGRLWNVRILPFYYLTVYLTAALAVGELIGWARSWLDRRHAARVEAEADTGRLGALAGPLVAGGCVALAAAAVLVMVALPLRSLPGGRLGDDGVYRWGPLSSSEYNLGTYWVQYNFEGYEGRRPTADGGGSAEYWDLVDTMGRVGESRGCGPSLWEYGAGRLGSYGTPMAPMLLPYWTDRCIGSMEGLYFEASATTPYHFLMQSELSAAPSRAQRDLPYSGLDVARGTEHLRAMGVRYYLAFSEDALRQARAVPGLAEVASSGPWVVFEVAQSAPVTGLARLPVVVDGVGRSSDSWLEASVGAFLAEGPDAPLLAADGPSEWPRMALPATQEESGAAGGSGNDVAREQEMRRLAELLPGAAPRADVEPAVVSDVVRRDHSISFSVDRVGAPVLVHTSYFPNWSASGAEGPYRVTPNFMVVVPTGTEVRLDYGHSAVEWIALVITLGGLVAVGWILVSRRHLRRP